jgi:hypothetical protein
MNDDDCEQGYTRSNRDDSTVADGAEQVRLRATMGKAMVPSMFYFYGGILHLFTFSLCHFPFFNTLFLSFCISVLPAKSYTDRPLKNAKQRHTSTGITKIISNSTLYYVSI